MRNRHLHHSVVFFLGAALLFFWGCVGGTSKSPTFYLLKTLPGSEAPALGQGGVAMEVGPIIFPAYLNRTQIASTGDDHQLHMDEFNRWAEPLNDGFGRVLAENLAVLLKTANVYIYPLRRDLPIDYQVEMTISQFSVGADGTATLVAYWSLIVDDGRKIMSRKRSFITEKAASMDFEAIVAAQNQTLEALSREIASEIQKSQ